MASSTVAPPQPPAPKPPTDPAFSAIDKRIRQTRRQLKVNDFATAAIALVAGVLGFLLVAAVADHWLVSGGLGFGTRLVLFLGLLGGAGWYCLRAILPPLIYRINPIFAARTLEQARPSLKNGLINLLLLRRESNSVSQSVLARRVVDGLQATAADELQQIPAEVAVDRSHLIRRGYVLVALVALAAVYLVMSPKNPVPSFARVLWPWARIAAPSRVQIEQLTPGNATVFQGRSVAVSAVVEGLRDGEEVLLRYSTSDGQIVDQAIPMTPGEGRNRYQCQLPPNKAGLQQSLRYCVTAGDCTTFEYLLEMEVPPTILVDTVRYIYPKYTGLSERVVTDMADVRAIEGAQIAVEATANREIEWAGIELSGQVGRRIPMRLEGKQARGQFKLELSPDDESARWYQLRFAESESGEGRENIDPVRHRIEVLPDRAPQVRWVETPEDSATIPLDGLAEMKLEASDPDFALSRVAFLARRGGRPLAIPLLLDRTDTDRGYEGSFTATYRFEPAELGLLVGDEVQYQAVAEDNKQPHRNRSETEPRWLKIGPPEQSDNKSADNTGQAGKTPGEQKPSQDQPGDATPQNPNDPDQGGNAEQGEEGSESGDPSQGGQENSEDAEAGSQQSDENQKGEAGAQGEQSGENGSASDQEGAQQEGSQANQDQENQKGQEGGQGDQAGQEGGNREQPVDPEAAGDVFEEILKQREKDMQKEGGQSKNEAQSDSEGQPGENSESKPKPGEDSKSGQGDPAGDPQAGKQSDNAKEHEGQSDVPPNRTEQGDQGGKDESPKNPEGMGDQGGQPDGTSATENQGQSPQTEDQSDASGGKPNGKPGKGESSEDAETVDGGKAKPEDLKNGQVDSVERQPHDPNNTSKPERSEKSQQGSPEAGEPNAGSSSGESKDNPPTPMPQEANQPNAKKPTGGKQADSQPKSDATSPSISKKQSDETQREPTDGDRSGDGAAGGGQDSDKKGQGTPGSSTPDQEGGSPGGEKGEGETGTGAGESTPTEKPTGNQAPQEGGKSEGQDGSEGMKPGQGSSDQNASPRPDQSSPDQNTNDGSGGTPGSDPSQRAKADPQDRKSAGGAGPNPGAGVGDAPPQDFGEEAANKEYAEKATDLALEYLEEQMKKSEPNQELLDRLGWSQQDLERFLRRWQQMKADANESGKSGEEASHELDDALKSLGLRPSRTSSQGGGTPSDTLRQTESIRTAPPAAWRERFQEYNKSIGSGTP